MSWWVYLEDKDGKPVEVSAHSEGGTYAVGGISEAELNVTYNYGKHFAFKTLNGKAASETVEGLTALVAKLGTDRDEDYWNPTPGNVGHAASILLAWAKQHPAAKWRVS
jgi:hypothetical protein